MARPAGLEPATSWFVVVAAAIAQRHRIYHRMLFARALASVATTARATVCYHLSLRLGTKWGTAVGVVGQTDLSRCRFVSKRAITAGSVARLT